MKSGKFIIILFLLIFGNYNIFMGWYILKTKNLYWLRPTFSGFKTRKQRKDSDDRFIIPEAVTCFLLGGILLILSVLIFINS
jgi:hypothetical protein